MRIDAPPRIRRPIPLTPLVDIVFLLLMFFMLSSTFSKFGALDVSRNARAAATAPPANPGVSVAVAGDGMIEVNGAAVALDRLADRLDELSERGAVGAVLRFSPEADVQDLVSVLEQARRSRLQPISITR